MQRLESSLPFMEVLDNLKRLRPTGWESVNPSLDDDAIHHTHQMIWYCYLHPGIEGEEETRAILMCIAKNISEITASDAALAGRADHARWKLERMLCVEYTSCLLAKTNPQLASQLPEIWLEYDAHASTLSSLVHQIDNLAGLHLYSAYKKDCDSLFRHADIDSLRLRISDLWLAQQADAILDCRKSAADQSCATPIVFIIGGPGVGKGTLCASLIEKFNYCHLGVGDLLREEQNTPGSVFSEFIAKCISNSVIVPPSLTMLLLKERILQAQTQGQGVLVDGFPRSVGQAIAFEQEISTNYCTIYLECTTENMADRVHQRTVEANSAPRVDDQMSVLSKRIDTFLQTNQSVLDHLENNSLTRINSNGSADDVLATAEQVIRSLDSV